MCRKVGSKRFGIVYEPCNLTHAGVAHKAALDILRDHLVHVHVKDGKMTPRGFERCHLGDGEIDYRWVVSNLERSGYRGEYALEYEICDLEAIGTGLPRWLGYFRAIQGGHGRRFAPSWNLRTIDTSTPPVMIPGMHLPLFLTAMRIFLSPLFFAAFLLVDRMPNLLIAVWCLFLIMEVSDFLDGALARLMKMESELGKVLDPFADSISRLTYFVCLSSAGILPVWILLILIYRDLGVSFVRLQVVKSEGMLPARWSGKVKAWVYGICGFIGLLAFTAHKTGWLPVDVLPMLQTVVQVLCYASGAVALWSLVDYASLLRIPKKPIDTHG